MVAHLRGHRAAGHRSRHEVVAREGDDDEVKIFHAGTKSGPASEILASGGRVLAVTALGSDIAAAQRRVYEAVDQIEWPEGFCRRDIGWRALGD